MPVDDLRYRFVRFAPFELQGWGGDDPERIVLEFLADQHLAVRNILGRRCDMDDAAALWAQRLAVSRVRLADESDPARVLAFTSVVPGRLGPRVDAAGYAVCLRRINSGRPFLAEWVVPFGLRRPLALLVASLELFPAEADVVLGPDWRDIRC